MVWATILKVLKNRAATYMYSAVIIHRIGTQQSFIVVHFLQERVRNTEQLQVHAGGRCAHNHLQLPLITIQAKQHR